MPHNASLNTSPNTPAYTPPKIHNYGDGAFLVQYDTDSFSMEICEAIHALAQALRISKIWTELVPGYDSLLCVFNMGEITYDKAKKRLSKTIAKHLQDTARKPDGKTVETAQNIIDIPAVYGGQYGPDMSVISQASGLSEANIINAHSQEPYRVCMMGFIPGFCFLSQAPTALHHPRRTTPRAHVPAGSIGIAGWQTGIYGLESPGGWQIIGRTPLKLFDKIREQPFLIKAGDKIRFVPSSESIFDD